MSVPTLKHCNKLQLCDQSEQDFSRSIYSQQAEVLKMMKKRKTITKPHNLTLYNELDAPSARLLHHRSLHSNPSTTLGYDSLERLLTCQRESRL